REVQPAAPHRGGARRGRPLRRGAHAQAAAVSARGVAARRSRVRLTARTWILAVVVTVLLISAVFPLRTYLSERTQVARLARQMQVIDAKNLELHGRIKHLHDRGYLE